MSNTTGRLFRVTTFGESHGPALGAVVDGCPPGLPLSAADVQADLDRRRPGPGRLTSRRKEPDRVEVLSGVFEDRTTGAPIALLIRNEDADPAAYEHLRTLYRPGHADFTWDARFGRRDHRGGGRASARETAARVAAGAVARRLLSTWHDVEVVAWVEAVGEVEAEIDPARVTRPAVDANEIRCPDPEAAARMAEHIAAIRKAGDTIGGVIGAVARGVPRGWGAPVFDKLGAELGHACLSIPACKGFEVGSGFRGARMRGTAHNDPFVVDPDSGRVRTTKNDAGGLLGGISTGEDITVRCAFKPVPTHFHPQLTIDRDGQPAELRNRGRHDPCVVPRAAAIVEAALLLVLADHALLYRTLGR
jgi:chorismate synthase